MPVVVELFASRSSTGVSFGGGITTCMCIVAKLLSRAAVVDRHLDVAVDVDGVPSVLLKTTWRSAA